MQIRQGLRGKLKRWETCPKNDGSLDSILISMGIDYRSGLGNQVLAKRLDFFIMSSSHSFTESKVDFSFLMQVWSYLSIWAIARRHNIRPVLPEDNLNKLAKMFDRSYFNIPSLRTIGIRCNLLPWILDTHYHSALIVGKPKDLFKKIQVTPRENITLLKVQVYEFDVFHTAPLWYELANDLVIRKELRDGADQILKQVRQNYSKNLVSLM
jgi:hypothetical protein